jgi:glycosyltransferase involved in cell wall biosynthesis
VRQALASVSAQTFTDYEVIVVDDGSKDGTWEELQTLALSVRIFRQENAGPGAARNLGIQNANGDYITFLDSDDVWFPWTLSSYAAAITKYGNVAFVAGPAVRFVENVPSINASPPTFSKYLDYFSSSRESIWIGTCGAAVDSKTLRSVGGFTNSRVNAEDSDLWLRLGSAAGFVHILAPPIFGYRQTPQSATTVPAHTYEGMIRIIENELCNSYPGGIVRRRERLRVITRHIRPASLNLVRSRAILAGMHLYARSFWWHFLLGRWKYLLGFWAHLLLGRLARIP